VKKSTSLTAVILNEIVSPAKDFRKPGISASDTYTPCLLSKLIAVELALSA
jgi:hypothetical protein